MTDTDFNTDRFNESGDLYDKYEAFAEEFNPVHTSRKARRKRKPRVVPPTINTRPNEVEDLADTDGLEAGFETTYQPSQFESGWLLGSLKGLYDQQFITDVVAQIKGGKEASVYRCAGHESTGAEWLAAKVYRPRMFRQLRKDHVYRQGRGVVMGDGTRLNDSDFREMRAISKGTGFGKKLQHTSWLMHEFKTMQALYEAGAAVPRAYASGDNVILMDYVGDAAMAAPLLSSVRLERGEARPLFEEVMRNVELLLDLGLAHGDLSAYNILYWDGRITLIDFPQVVDIHGNPEAYDILLRDLTRICDYFRGQRYEQDPADLMNYFWRRYVGLTPFERQAEEARFVEAEQEDAALDNE